MATKQQVRAVLQRLSTLVQNQPSEFDKIDDEVNQLAAFADQDWATYSEVLQEEGVDLLLDESESQAMAKAQFGELVRALGLYGGLPPTEDNIAGVYHAFRLKVRAFSSTRSPETRSGNALEDTAVWYPHDKQSLANMLSEAFRLQRRVSVLGSYRSLSDVPDVTGTVKPGPTLIVTSFLNKLVAVDTTKRTYTCEPGRAIWQINADLERAGLAMPNLGGGDFQTVMGAIGTATHGSGRRFADFSMFVQSFELLSLDDKGAPYFKTFQRGDPDFDAVIVSMGAMGVVTQVTLQVQDKFFLRERRTVMPWSEARKLVDRYVAGELKVRHFEVLVVPYKTSLNVRGIVDADDKPLSAQARNGEDNVCLVTRRHEVPQSEVGGKRPDVMRVAQKGFGRWAARVGLDLMLQGPNVVPQRLVGAVIGNQVDNYADLSWKVLKLGLLVEARAAEYSMRIEDATKATDIILGLAAQRFEAGAPIFLAGPQRRREFWSERPMHTSPISLRFVAAGTSALSMNEGRDSCMIEVPMLMNSRAEALENGTNRDQLFDAYVVGRLHLFREIFTALDQRLRGPKGEPTVRPHWGLENPVANAGTAWITPRWSRFPAWKQAYDRHNVTGVFNCAFTDRLQISVGHR